MSCLLFALLSLSTGASDSDFTKCVAALGTDAVQPNADVQVGNDALEINPGDCRTTRIFGDLEVTGHLRADALKVRLVPCQVCSQRKENIGTRT
jgi:hypothetical protein